MSTEIITDAETMVQQELEVPVEGLLALAHAPPSQTAHEPGDIFAHAFESRKSE